MTASALELIGILVACGAAAATLVLEQRRWRHAAMVVALLVAPADRAGRRLGRAARGRLSPQPGAARGRPGGRRRRARRLRGGLPTPPGVVCDRRLRRPAPPGPGRDRGRDGEPARAALPGDRRRPDREHPLARARDDERRAGVPMAQAPALAAGGHRPPLRDPILVLGRRAERDREHRLLPRPVRGPLRARARGGLEPSARPPGAHRGRRGGARLRARRHLPVLRPRPLPQPRALRLK